MKAIKLIGLVIFLLLHSASGDAPIKSKLVSAQLDSQGETKKLVLNFGAEIPVYTVSYDKSKKVSEVHWTDEGSAPLQRDFMLSEAQSLIRRVVVTVDPKSRRGVMRIWHDINTNYLLSKENLRNLVLYLPQDSQSARNPSSGKKISLNIKNAPLVKILRNVATESNRSLVIADEVSGSVSANIEGLNYEEAVNTILKATPYHAQHSANVTVVRADKGGKSFRAFKLRNIDVNLILKTIQEVISKDGQASVDTNTNSLFVVDRIDVLNNVDQMIAILDHEPRQVEVEAAIVELDNKNGLDMGFGFNAPFSGKDISGSVSTQNLYPSSVSPTNTAAQGMFVGLSWKSVSGILSLMASQAKLSVLAKPRVLALSDQEASIVIGSQIGYNTVTVTPSGNVQDVKFITVGTLLKIKPHITQVGDILMYIRPEISDGSLDERTNLPNTTTTSSETKVLAKDGQTIVIGGLLRDKLEKTITKVPLLGDIPILGLLFRGSTETMTKNELVIVLSPKILTNGVRKISLKGAKSITNRAIKDLDLSPMQSGVPFD
jgi:type II secretory pathway component GspD/PulD (secretin)